MYVSVVNVRTVFIYLSVASQINTSLRALFIKSATFVAQPSGSRAVASTIAPRGSPSPCPSQRTVRRVYIAFFRPRQCPFTFLSEAPLKTSDSPGNRRSNCAPRSRQSLRTYFTIVRITPYVILFLTLLSSLVLHVHVYYLLVIRRNFINIVHIRPLFCYK